ncbi:MAG: urate hydroxylase PuuD [Ktedonobacteraceae bacterium]
MELNPVVYEWLNMIVRWLHVTTAMAWIGTSFYFMATDMKLKPGEGLPEGAAGEAWQVHGGNFWRMMKFTVAPTRMPRIFTWYLWDSRVTWLSGFVLLILVYYMQADLFLIDKSVMDLTPLQAGLFSLVSLLAAWFAYDALCRSPLGKHEIVLAVVVYVFLVVITYAFTRVLSGRAAVNQIGAIVGTFMVANALTVIHPNQRKSVNALFAGQRPAAELVIKARQRSIHNNYLTLPVILLMLSNHYPLLYATRFNWVIVAIILALGPFIRHFFNTRNAGKGNPWWTWAVVAAGMLAIAYLFSFGPREKTSEIVSKPSFADVKQIILSRCSMCHMKSPVWAGIRGAGGGILLKDTADIRRNAGLINVAAVLSNAMPPGNVTEMTPKERSMLARWLAEPRDQIAQP